MRSIRPFGLLAALTLAATFAALAQTAGRTPAGQSSTGEAQTRVVGEVTAVDTTAGRVTVRTEDGRGITLGVDAGTSVRRVPAGETNPEKAVRATLADVKAGDRVFARAAASADGSLTARQLVVTSGAGVAAPAGGGTERRGQVLVGRVTAVNAAKKEITVTARAAEGVETLTVDAAGEVKFLRFAADSARAEDAAASSLASLRAGDLLRARGERQPGGARFKAEEIISGSFVRLAGAVAAVNAANNEFTLKDVEGGGTTTVVVGRRTTLRRVPPDVAASFTQRREERRAARGDREDAPRAQGEARDGGRAEGGGRGGRREGQGRGDARGLQRLFENLPATTLAELKPGDAVIVTASTGADASRVTAVSLVTGEAEFMRRLQRLFGRREGEGLVSPGLPGDILGGGIGNVPDRDRP